MDKPKANIRLAARAEALGEGPVSVGVRTVAVLPAPSVQRRGWYAENADELVALYRGRFLKIVSKGVRK